MSVFCKHCGMEFKTVMILSMGSCQKSPSKKHELYEGSIKPQYTCKHCGMNFRSLQIMSMATCNRSANKRHEAAL